MNAISNNELKEIVNDAMENYHKSNLEKIKNIELKKLIGRRNPYLYRAQNSNIQSKILIKTTLNDFMTSSIETVFGNLVFEPIATAITAKISNGQAAPVEGVDIVVQTTKKYTAYAVKSGTNPQNASAKKRQNEEFNSIRARVAKAKKQFDPVVAYSYGTISDKRKEPTKNKNYREVAGKEFWEEISGDSNMYQKISMLIGSINNPNYENEIMNTEKRLHDEFVNKGLSTVDGKVNWDKFTEFVSEKSW
ncbi:MAG: hypothetical protein CL758_09040 [Chloroflexi bacterium]|nr:hypothetical protein [Chloroflexota bacterium]|tara:strand:- start:4378 stop:5124 length:747 start_codon:yes stop_codon:yes gene_type:complete